MSILMLGPSSSPTKPKTGISQHQVLFDDGFANSSSVSSFANVLYTINVIPNMITTKQYSEAAIHRKSIVSCIHQIK